MRLGGILLCLVSSVLLLVSASAQTSTGNISGRVTDPSGALLPGARITAKSLGTGATRTATTEASGTYAIVNLEPGGYAVDAEAAGFATRRVSPVTVNVGITTTVDVAMKVAEVTQQVEVQAVNAQIDVQNTTVQSVITESQLETLPVNGRNFQQLAILSPGASNGSPSVGSSFDSTKTRVGAVSVSGGPGRYINISIDGGDANDDFVGGQNLQISQDAVQEFSIVTQRYNAENGRATGGVINVVTKSGTNQWHGDGFWFLRDKSISAKNPLQENQPKPEFRNQQYGATLGGPLKRDLAHFFLAYERQQENRAAIYSSNGAFPSADGTIQQPFWQNMYLAKVTLQATPSLSFILRYSQENNKLRNDTAGVPNATPGAVVNIFNDFHTLLAGFTKVGKHYVNEFRFQYSDYNEGTVDPRGNENAPSLIFPNGVFGHNPQAPQFNVENKYQFRDTLGVLKANHDLKFGIEYIYQPDFGAKVGFGRNQFFYANDDYDPATNTVGPTNSIQSFTTFSQPLGNALNPALHYLALFAQDEWHVTPRLSLNLGLRYDFEKNLLIARDTPTNQILYPGTGRPHEDHNNIAPRIGFTFDLFGNRRTVLNGGYGLYYEYQAITASTLYEALNQLPNPYQFIFVPPPVPFGPDNIPDFTGQSGFEIGFANSVKFVNPKVHQFSVGVSHQITEKLVLESGFVGVFGRDLMAFFDFNPIINATTGERLRQAQFPTLGGVQMFGSGAKSRYLAWYAQFRYRAKQLEFQASYRLSQAKANTDSTQGAPADGVLDQVNWPNDPTEYGPTNFDERHRLVGSFTYYLPARFTVSGIIGAASARPYTPICNGCDPNGDGFAGFFGVGDRTGPRGSLRGNPTFTLDLRVAKEFGLGEHAKLQLIFETFNITNKANYGNNFQRISEAPDFQQPINIATPPRQAQIGVRATF
jgi:hypothetical protein